MTSVVSFLGLYVNCSTHNDVTAYLSCPIPQGIIRFVSSLVVYPAKCGFWSIQSQQGMSQRGDSRGSQGSSRASSSTSTGLTQDLDAMNVGDEDQASPRAGTRSNPMAVAGVQALSKPDLDERKLESFQRQHAGE